MYKKKSLKAFGLCLILLTTLACSLVGVGQSATQEVNPSLTKEPGLQSTSAPINTLPPTFTQNLESVTTPTPRPSIKQEWTIKTGNIQYFGVAADGTIYGVGPKLYAIISKDGNVLQTNEVNLRDCLRDNFSGGSGDTEIDRWFVAKPDGTILSTSFNYPCIVSPGNPPKIEKNKSGDFFPYADDTAPRKTPTTPDGFANNLANPYLYSSKLGGFNFFINKTQKIGAFIDHNGQIHNFNFPQDMNMEQLTGDTQIAVTPWDDAYITVTLP